MSTDSEKLHVTAVVTVTLEVPLTQHWPSDSPIDVIFRQAERDALEHVRRLDYPLVGKPIVRVVTTVRARE